MRNTAIIPFLAALFLLLSAASVLTQVKMRTVPLDTLNELKLRNVKTEVVTYEGRRALRVKEDWSSCRLLHKQDGMGVTITDAILEAGLDRVFWYQLILNLTSF